MTDPGAFHATLKTQSLIFVDESPEYDPSIVQVSERPTSVVDGAVFILHISEQERFAEAREYFATRLAPDHLFMLLNLDEQSLSLSFDDGPPTYENRYRYTFPIGQTIGPELAERFLFALLERFQHGGRFFFEIVLTHPSFSESLGRVPLPLKYFSVTNTSIERDVRFGRWMQRN